MSNNFHGPRYFVDAKEDVQYVITFNMGRPAEMVALNSKTGMTIPPQVLFSGDNKDKTFTAVDDETLEVFSIKTQQVQGIGLGIAVEATGQNVDKLPDGHPTGADAARRFDDNRRQQAERLKDLFGGLFGGGNREDRDPDESPFGGLGDLFGGGEDQDDNWTPPKREPVQTTTPRGQRKPGMKGVPNGGYKVSDSALEKVLHKFGTDLTEEAMKGNLDPIVGRDEDLSKLKQFLLRKNKSSVNILGEAGTGKTAMFDALAQDIVAGKAEEELADARVIMLDITGMNATDQAKFRGQFEKELKKVLDGLEERGGYINGQKIILCLDEIHSILGAGAVSGNEGGGAAQIMKPFLARGSVTCVGTTTLKEHKKYIEKDGALNRRFQPLYLEETNEEATLFILGKVNDHYGKYHGMDETLSDEQLKRVVKTTNRFMPTQYQPDKAIGVLDDAMAIARKEGRKSVTDDDITAAVAKASNLDKQFLNQDDHERFITLEEKLPQLVLGQDEQLETIVDRLMSARAGLTDPNQPWGAFLVLGPTGVGKTETCYGLGELLHGSRDSVIRIDMSKYSEKHSVSGLIGSPPGYVGHEDTEGELEKVRDKPYSIIVLDEVEKAHPDVFNILLPILQDGEIEDSRGRKISFKNTVIVMTSNLGAGKSGKTIGHIADNNVEEDRQMTYMAAAKSQFRPELLNRINMLGGTVVFNRLEKPVIDKLVKREVEKVAERLQDASGGGLQLENITLKVADEVCDALAEKGYQPEYGARPLQAEVQRNLAQPLGRWLMKSKSEYNSKLANGEDISDELKAIFDKRSKAEIFIDETGKTMTPKIKVIELAKEKEPVLETVGAEESAAEEKTTQAPHVEKTDKPESGQDSGKINIPVKSNDNAKDTNVPIKTQPPRIRPRSNGGPKK